ncbi:hypothetical protein HI914_02857 [Erysiphe necator]|nr:hypothetical protein HI914_02857 [Erysiphe necator]
MLHDQNGAYHTTHLRYRASVKLPQGMVLKNKKVVALDRGKLRSLVESIRANRYYIRGFPTEGAKESVIIQSQYTLRSVERDVNPTFIISNGKLHQNLSTLLAYFITFGGRNRINENRISQTSAYQKELLDTRS